MSDAPPLHLRFDAFDLDEGNARLTRDGVPIAMPPKVFAVLCALARKPGQLVTKEALLDSAWGHQHVSESVLKTTISQLRSALDDDAKQPRYIETASRRGYRFITNGARTLADPAASAASPPLARPDAQASIAPAPEGPAMIGRRAPLAKLMAAWNRAMAGARQVMWVSGEAGVGKTTLIDSFVRELGDVACAHGQCVEQFGAGEPYLPVLEALGALCRKDSALPSMMRSIAPTWLLQLPWLTNEADRAALQRELSGTSQDRMLREMGELLEQYTRTQPLLLVTEDLHWSDHATVRLIDHLARRRGLTRLMWLGTFRSTDLVAGDHPLKGVRQELRVHRLCDEIALDPFSESEVADYIDERFPGADASEEFVRSLHAHTDGLPLFVVNVIDDLLSQGAVAPGLEGSFTHAAIDEHWTVPENLAGVIESQIGRLPGELRVLLTIASAAGMEFQPDTVAAAIGRDAAWVHEVCDRLARRYQWLSLLGAGRLADGTLDARYAFRHAIYRHVFYQRMTAATRVEAHLHIARSMEKRRQIGHAVTSAELATHYELGHDVPSALRHYAEAAAAVRTFAPHEAIQLCERALVLLPRCPGGPERDALEMAIVGQQGFASTQLLGVAAPEAMRALERARELSDKLPPTPERAWVLSGLGWVYYVRGEFDASRAIAHRIHALAVELDDRVLLTRACNLLGVAIGYNSDLHVAREWLERGLAVCAELGDKLPYERFVVDPEVSMRANLCMPLMQMGLTDQAHAQVALAIARAATVRQPIAHLLAHWAACMVEIRLRNPERVLALAETLGTITATHSVGHGEGPSRWCRGWAQAQLGDPIGGHRLTLEGYERHARYGMYAGCPIVLCFAAEALALAGDWDGAARHVDEGLALAQRMGETVAVPDLLFMQARVGSARGDREAARASLQEAVAQSRLHGAQGYEIDALIRLCEQDDSRAQEALAALREACTTLPQGFDVALARNAQTLLATSP